MRLVFTLSLILLPCLFRDVLSNSRQCVCVAYHDCYYNYTLKGHVTDFHEIRTYYDNRPRPSCASAIDVCCNQKDNSATDNYYPDTAMDKPPVEEWACGYLGDKSNVTGFGERAKAKPGEFPWMVAVLRKDKLDKGEGNGYHCGGSLINKKAVLTSASEVYKFRSSNLVVRVGQYDWRSKGEHQQDIKVSHIHIHPNFNADAFVYNYAILILAEAAKPGAHVNSICLPATRDDYRLSECIETGWGDDCYDSDCKDSYLRKSEMYIMSRKTCEGVYQMTYNVEKYKIHRSVMCAGDDNLKAPCTGVEGSPIICPIKSDESRYVQVGIASAAVCNQRYKPGLYADVSTGYRWINRVINSRDLNSDSYTA